MGNCMETYTQRAEEAGETQQQREERERSRVFVKEDSEGRKSVRVKVVLTKEELEWLILELSLKQGMGLEQVLQEIERSRAKVEGWKPSLDSIMEIPEVSEMDR